MGKTLSQFCDRRFSVSLTCSKPPKILFFVGDLGYFCSHRLALALAATKAGYEVWVTAPHPSKAYCLPLEIHTCFLPRFARGRLGLKVLMQEKRDLQEVFRRVNPDIVHNVAMKPICLGTWLAPKHTKIINDFGGLGYLFTKDQSHFCFKKWILRQLFGRAFSYLTRKRTPVVVCQNTEDAAVLSKYIPRHQTIHCIPGSGVDLEGFSPLPLPSGPPWRLLFAARLLKEKGLGELIEAKKLLKGLPLEIWVCGDVDPQNPSSFTRQEIQAWHDAGHIRWLGSHADLKPIYAQVHSAILPSYREGLPRTLIEAAAWGRSVLTTSVPGCSRVVVNQVTGYLAKPRSAQDLARIIALWVTLEDKIGMGCAGHAYVRNHFSKEMIHPKILTLYASLL
jgi:glycosyltransferase involved in cell wall biosynthesis